MYHFWRQGLFTGLELVRQATLADLWFPGFTTFCLSDTEITSVRYHTRFFLCAGAQNPCGLCAPKASTFQTVFLKHFFFRPHLNISIFKRYLQIVSCYRKRALKWIVASVPYLDTELRKNLCNPYITTVQIWLSESLMIISTLWMES